MEPLTLEWPQLVLVAIQLGYSWWLKNYSTLPNKWIPMVNLGIAAVYFTIAIAIKNPEGGIIAAIIAILVKSAETAVISTGAHSALKSTFEKTTGIEAPKP